MWAFGFGETVTRDEARTQQAATWFLSGGLLRKLDFRVSITYRRPVFQFDRHRVAGSTDSFRFGLGFRVHRYSHNSVSALLNFKMPNLGHRAVRLRVL